MACLPRITMTCKLCELGVPAPTGMETQIFEFHHIVPKSQGGTDDPTNLIELCRFHHSKFQSSAWKNMFWLAKIETGESTIEDYPYFHTDECANAILGTCIGGFGEGTWAFELGIPDTLKSIFCGRVDARIDKWCEHLCPVAVRCLQQTRKALMEEVECKKLLQTHA